MHIYKCHYTNVLLTKFRSTFRSHAGSRGFNIIHGSHPCTDGAIKVFITAVKDTDEQPHIFLSCFNTGDLCPPPPHRSYLSLYFLSSRPRACIPVSFSPPALCAGGN